MSIHITAKDMHNLYDQHVHNMEGYVAVQRQDNPCVDLAWEDVLCTHNNLGNSCQ